MKYPFILFFRDDKYANIDLFFKANSDKLNCTLHIVNKKEKLNKFYKQIYPMLIIYEKDSSEHGKILSDFNSYKVNLSNRILFITDITDINNFNEMVNKKYIDICCLERDETRPIFSIFTPAFNSFEKIIRAYNSLKNQLLTNWEWIIMDDSPDEKNFIFLKENILTDARIRLYRRFENNGYIGNIKNEAVALCRGKYLLELDHDDEILPFVLEDSATLFDTNPEIGFIYMDFINIYENGDNFFYNTVICKGYGSYYCQKYNDKWVYVYNTPNINNITLSHLACCPNHPRIWRKDVLLKIGNFCEYLPICDDYEIILRTSMNTKIAKIHKMGYVQYINNDNNNFSLIRNKEINRIGPEYISPIYYNNFNIHNEMKKLDAYEDEKYIYNHSKIWSRDDTYEHKYCNKIVNNDYNKQYCIIGLDSLILNKDKITLLYADKQNDFLLLDNKHKLVYLQNLLDSYGFYRFKCYAFIDETPKTLIKYFMFQYKSCDNYEIINN